MTHSRLARRMATAAVFIEVARRRDHGGTGAFTVLAGLAFLYVIARGCWLMVSS